METTLSIDDQVSEPKTWQGAKLGGSAGIIALGCVLWFAPTPDGLSTQAWHLFAIFLATIIGLIAKPLPMGAIALSSIAVAIMTDTISLQKGLTSFSSSVVWLIVCAFLLARGFIKTGLGSRIAYHFIALLGKNTLGLAYGLTATELLLAPFMPSNTARGAGIVYPIIMALNKEYNSTVEQNTHERIGSYLIKLMFQVNIVTSAMFLTATAANPLIAAIAAEHGVTLTWTSWAMACIVPGLLNLLILPIAIFKLNPPALKTTPEAPAFAREKLAGLGALKFEEKIMLSTFAVLLVLWVFGSQIGVAATSAAISGLCILLFFGVLTWDDVVKEHSAWNTFIWMAVLIMLSSELSNMGMMAWFSKSIQGMISEIPWLVALLVVAGIYHFSHYLFASMTAHVTALFGTLLIVALASGVPPGIAVLSLACISSLCAGITHYGTGCAPVYFGANYLSVKKWWQIGGVMSIINLSVWLIIGSCWWKVLGYW